jgi:hypothetical protein
VHSKGDNFNPEKKKHAKKPFTLKVETSAQNVCEENTQACTKSQQLDISRGPTVLIHSHEFFSCP